MTTTSKIAICSNALLELGDNPISSFALSEGKRARLCGNLWDQVRDELLRKHAWPCCRKVENLAPEATAYSPDWGYSFLLPGDWLRTLQIGARGERMEYEHIGRRLCANTNALPLIYVWRNEDPAQWDSTLVDLATKAMVARMAYAITQSASLAELKAAEFKQALKEAKAVAGQDNAPEDWGDSPFVEARY